MKHLFVPLTDLASAHFPYITPRAARRKLIPLINANATILSDLQSIGYTPGTSILSPAQTDRLFAFFGNPLA